MPRSRGSEMPQRSSPCGSNPLRTSTSSSDSGPLRNRSVTDRKNPKIGDRRSPRGLQPDSLNQKKLGTRISDLECQLGQAQEELRILKEQLASAEPGKKDAQQQLSKNGKKSAVKKPEEFPDKHSVTEIADSREAESHIEGEASDATQQETDVYEVLVEKKPIEVKVEPDHLVDQLDKENKPLDPSSESQTISEPEKPSTDELALKNTEIKMLKSRLEEKEKELQVCGLEKEDLKNQLHESSSNAKDKEGEMSLRLSQLGEELEASKAKEADLKQKLEATQGAKEALEAEMKKMRVQTDQWRKAADAAAAVLAGGVEMNERITERCGSMDKHFGSMFQTPADGYAGFLGSPGVADNLDDGFRSGKHKGPGIRMFSELWKKKSQK